MVSVVDIACLSQVVGMSRINEISYLCILLIFLGVFVLVFDLGFDIEEGASRVLLSALVAPLLRNEVMSAFKSRYESQQE